MNQSKKSRKLPRFFIVILLVISLIAPTIPFVSADWLEGWDLRVKINIDHDDIDGALSDFPVLIYLNDSSGINNEDVTFVFDEVGANSLKIAVTENDGTTECYVEVEKWDFGNEQAWLWAKVPSIASDADTDIYLYYDNDHADNVAYVGVPNSVPAENVWDASFKFVSHMRDDPDNQHIRDSTTNDKDATKVGAGQPAVTTSGIIDDAQHFDGTNDQIPIPNTIMTAASPFTAEFWFYCTGENAHAENWQQLLDLRGQYIVSFLFFEKDDATHPGEVRLHVGATLQYSSELNYDTWYHVVGTHDLANNMRLYINGDLVDGPDAQADPGADADTSKIGKDYTAQVRGFFEGIIDDVRISQTARLGSWIKANYETSIDDLLNWGLEEEEDISSIVNIQIVASDSTVDDEQWFFLNASIEILTNTSTFLFNRIDLDPTGLNLSCSYTNATNTFAEESDTNNYLELDVSTSVKTDENSTNVRIDYYLRLHPNVTKDGLYNVTVYSTASGDLNDTDTFTDVFTLTIRTPSAPTLLYGAGFNSSSPYVELHWTNNLELVTLFEVQNSSNDADWTYLGTNTTAWYTDSTVSNGTERYYKVRACRDTGVGWKNSSFTGSNFETVYFVQATGNGDTYVTGSIGIFLMAFIVLLPIIIYAVKKK